MAVDKGQDRLVGDVESPAFQNSVIQGLWELVKQSGNLLDVRIAARDSTWFHMQLDCSNYWEQAISGQFVDPDTRQCVVTAWPQGNEVFQQWIKYTPGNLFICWDQDRIGLAKHPEWLTRKAWQRKSNQLVAYLEFIRTLLWLPCYGYSQRKD